MDIEREAFEQLPDIKGILQDGYGFNSELNQYFHPDIENHRLGCAYLMGGWMAYQAQSKKLEGCVVVPEAEFAILPKTITPEIEEILGMPCFKFIKAAQIYRQLGFDVPPKAEKEQSFFMFKFLHLALIHGDKCFDVFESETKAMLEAARVEMKTKAINDVLAERERQINKEHYSTEHDDEYKENELLRASVCYAENVGRGWVHPEVYQSEEAPDLWPWDLDFWKPKNPRADLVRAAALLIAEIERLDRKEPKADSEVQQYE